MNVRKILSLLIAGTMALSCFGMTALAEETEACAVVNSTSYSTLGAAIAAAADGDVITISGTFTEIAFDGAKTLTFEGAEGTGATLDFSSQVYHEYYNAQASNLTFKNLTIKRSNAADYTGMAHANSETYDDCTIEGKFWGYAKELTFNSCKFIQTIEDYNIWTYGSDTTFNNCTFESLGKSVLVYNEGSEGRCSVKVNSCNFAASAASAGKAAIEIDSRFGAFDVEVTASTAAGFDAVGEVSGLVHDKTEEAIEKYGSTGAVYYNESAVKTNLTVDGKKLLQSSADYSLETVNCGSEYGEDESFVTGFITTVNGNEFKLNNIRWTVKSGENSQTSGIFSVGNIDINGSAKIGLIVSGLDDTAATAKAVINVTE